MFDREIVEKLNENEMRMYEFLLSVDLEKISVREVAKKSFTSPAAVIRMSKKLGYSGYSEFIFELKKHRKTRGEKYKIDIEQEGVFIIRDEKEIERFLETIHEGKILIYAEGFSEIISTYMYKKMVVLGKNVTLFHGVDYEMVNKNPFNKSPFTAAIIISKSGENPYCLRFAQYMKEYGARVISFTGNSNSSLSNVSEISFTYEDPQKHDKDIFYPNPFFGYMIVGFEELVKLYFGKYLK